MNGTSYNLEGLDSLQKDIAEWRLRNFGPPKDVGDRMLGVMEEVGELAHILLKRKQGIRMAIELSEEQLLDLAKDAIGDTLVYIMGVPDILGLRLSECLKFAWDEVKDRDWVKFPKDGVSE
jgi:NTP pyrophosphatase (non-canonical NTP hydrolase)